MTCTHQRHLRSAATRERRRIQENLSSDWLTALISTEFIDEHPGGPRVIQRFAGKNATKAFWKYHGDSVLAKYGDKYKIGAVEESAKL